MFSLARSTVFLTLAGSQAHGTAHDTSDVDIRGVCIAPMPIRLSLFEKFEQYEGPLDAGLGATVAPRLESHPTASQGQKADAECVIFDIAKFLRLCTVANPNALEILFADERDWLLETSVWRRLHDERYRFLTTKVQQTFLGYATAQLKKIKTHRSWLLHPPATKPSREDFGLPTDSATLSRDDQNRIEQSIAEKLRSYSIESIDMPKHTRIAVRERLEAFHRDLLAASDDALEARMRAVATDALNLPADVVAALNAEKKYRAAMKHWESYEKWKSHRNRARAVLESEHGYDTKHAMHLIRLMRMGLEALERHELIVRRADAAELSHIRDGALSFDQLLAAADGLRKRMENAAKTTTLPADVDRKYVDELVVELLRESLSAR